jgi:bifunctional non-homologous end joining protein LigD
MPLLRIPQPFDHEDFIYELKLDGCRALAFIENGGCRLISRNGYEFGRWEALKGEIARSVKCRSAVLDGEIVCLDRDGRSNFYALMFRRRAPFFCAFDALPIKGRDVRGLPLLERKRRLFDIMPRVESCDMSITFTSAASSSFVLRASATWKVLWRSGSAARIRTLVVRPG